MWFWITGMVVFILDRLSKVFITARLELTETIPIIKGFFHITYVKNPGAAFGLLQHQKLFFIIVAIIILIVIIYLAHKMGTESILWSLALGLIAGGAAGNMVDRLQTGLVIDFIDFRGIWPFIFNIADSAVVVGAFLLAVQILRTEKI